MQQGLSTSHTTPAGDCPAPETSTGAGSFGQSITPTDHLKIQFATFRPSWASSGILYTITLLD